MLSHKVKLVCPTHKTQLEYSAKELEYYCSAGCVFPVETSIPRFVGQKNYATSFGLQWNEYRTTQLDSRTGMTISKDRLTRILGGSLEVVKEKQVLEAGCGAGRFSEILLEAGAILTAVDLSTAVEANYKNCSSFLSYFVCQADIMALPFFSEQFDVVICIGVIQHTKNPEETMAVLCEQLRPGGLLVIDHYTHDYPVTLFRRLLRSVLIKLPGKVALVFCKILTIVLWPLHRLLWLGRRLTGIKLLRKLFLHLSPIVDYQDAYPQLGGELLRIWATLDTHDTLTDYYKHLRSVDEIREHLLQCGMENIEAYYAGNGLEARARKWSAKSTGGA